jgi:hypothetical protein
MSGRQSKREGELAVGLTWQEAIAEVALIDVSDIAREVSISYFTVLTRAAWDTHVLLPENAPSRELVEDILRRLLAAISAGVRGPKVFFEVQELEPGIPEMAKAVFAPGNMLTIMLPEED